MLTICFLLLATAAAARDVPPLRGRVNDTANLLQPNQVQTLESQLNQLERDTGHQVAVLTVPALDGEDIEGFSMRVAENWKIGKKGFDDGVILVVAVKDRKLRLEVGYGVEGILPDAIAKRIIADYIVPHFRQKDFGGGIVAGLTALDKILRKEPLPESARKKPTRRGSDLNSLAMLAITVGVLGLMGFASATNRRRSGLMGMRGRHGPVGWGGGWHGGGGFGGGSGGGFSGGGGGFGGGGASGSW